MAEQHPRAGRGLGRPRAAAQQAILAYNEFTLARGEMYALPDEPSKRSNERWHLLWSGTLRLLQQQERRALERLWAKLDRHGLLDRNGNVFREAVLPVPPLGLLEAVRAFARDAESVSLQGRRRRQFRTFDDLGFTSTDFGPPPEVSVACLYRAAYLWCEKQDTLNRWREKRKGSKPAPRLRGGHTRQERALALTARLANQYTDETIRRYVKIGRRAMSKRQWAGIRWARFLTPEGELKK